MTYSAVCSLKEHLHPSHPHVEGKLGEGIQSTEHFWSFHSKTVLPLFTLTSKEVGDLF